MTKDSPHLYFYARKTRNCIDVIIRQAEPSRKIEFQLPFKILQTVSEHGQVKGILFSENKIKKPKGE